MYNPIIYSDRFTVPDMIKQLAENGIKAEYKYYDKEHMYELTAFVDRFYTTKLFKECRPFSAPYHPIQVYNAERRGIVDSIIKEFKEHEKKENSIKLPEIKKVVFNKPATIVIWTDDTKTVVKAQNGETFDPEKGLAMAITKKALGNEGRYFDVIKKHVGYNLPERELIEKSYKTKFENLGDKCSAVRNCLFFTLCNKKATKADLIAAMQKAIKDLEREQCENA